MREGGRANTELDLYVTSPASIQILCLAGYFAFYTGLAILAGVDVNTTYADHYLRLKAIMNLNENLQDSCAHRSCSYRAKAREIAHAYKVSFRHVSAVDAVNYTRLFGVGISTNLLTFYGTVISSLASMFIAACTAMVRGGKY